MGLKDRLDKLENLLVKDGRTIMLPSQVDERQWREIETSRNLTAIIFYPEDGEADRDGQIRTITRLRNTAAKLLVLSMGDGTAMIQSGKCVGDSRLANKIRQEL